MARRRMFSVDIVDTDKFLDMPATAQLLYFHLGMRADDDGFVASPRKIMTLAGCGQDNMKILLAKGFVIAFESGVCVITDWNQNNQIRSDRYKPTVYQQERRQLKTDENGCYYLASEEEQHPLGLPNGNQTTTIEQPVVDQVETVGQPNDNQTTTSGIPNGNQMETVGQPVVDQMETQYRLGESRLGEERERAPRKRGSPSPPGDRLFFGEFGNVLLTEDEKSKLDRRLGSPCTADYIEQLSA
ncbi:MAG: hypothetical protein FWF06_06390, partial [Symbiobacteriaceae bacterium]|nr:hypothetical protein [Symbiobacteriaceae bacterium]